MTLLPLALFVAWVAFVGFVNTHQRHAMRFEGASRAYQIALWVSTSYGVATGLGLLIFYGSKTAWYWPLILFFVGSIVAGAVFAVLEGFTGVLALSMVSFAGWPISALVVYWAISRIRG